MKATGPTRFQLAQLAATLAVARPDADPAALVRRARALWCAADPVDLNGHTHSEEPVSTIRTPRKFPAPFDQFLRLVVGGRVKGDRLHRFRQWQIDAAKAHRFRRFDVSPSEEEECRRAAEDAVVSWRANPIGPGDWMLYAGSFSKWWENKRHQDKSLAGRTKRS